MKKRLLLIYFIIFYCHAIFAQLHIAKDNINCLYGLKNENNKWLLKPTYTYIEEAYHNSSVFQVFDGQYRGIISAEDGKVIIPCCQDRFDINSHYFLGYKNEKIMVYNRNGKPLSEQIYDDIKPYEFSHDYLWCYKNYPDSVLTSLMQVDVGFLFHDVNGYVHEWMDSTYTIVQKYKDLSNHYIGVIDSLGKTIIPQNYNSIEIKKGYFIATNDTATFFLNDKNILIYPPFLSIEKAFKSKSYLYLLSNKDSSSAIIDDKLNIIIPFNKYDKIKFLRNGKYWYQNGDSEIKNLASLFYVTKNNKVGVIDSAGNEIIQISYEYLKPIIINDTSVKFAFKENNKFGIINEKGEIILNANYNLPIIDSRYIDDKDQVKYLVNDKEVYFIDYYTCNLSKLDYLFENKFGSVFYGHNRVVLIKNSPLINKPILFYNSDSIYVDLDNYSKKNRYVRIHRKTKLGQFALHVYDLKGEEIFANRLQQFDSWRRQFGDEYFITTRSHHQGVFSVNTDKLIIDTLYSNITSPFWLENQNLCLGKLVAEKGYHAFDTLGTKFVPDILDTVIFKHTCDYNFLMATALGKMGVIGLNRKWFIEPMYNYITPLTENYFLIVNQNKKIGLIDIHNKLIVDTIYTDFLPVFNNFNCDFFATRDTLNGFTANKKEMWWLFKNDEKRNLINNKGKTISCNSSTDNNSKLIDSLLFKFAFNGEDFYCMNGLCHYEGVKADGSHNIAEGAFKIIMGKSDKEFLLKQSYVKTLYTILNKSYTDQIKILNKKNRPMLGFTTDENKTLNQIVSKQIFRFGKNFVSLSANSSLIKTDGLNSWYDYDAYSYENYTLKNKTLSKISLLDIFGDLNNLMKELLLTISNQEDLFLDCSTNQGLLEKVNGRFSLSNKGVSLYILNDHYDQQELLIPISRLKINTKSQWIVPYLN